MHLPQINYLNQEERVCVCIGAEADVPDLKHDPVEKNLEIHGEQLQAPNSAGLEVAVNGRVKYGT